jgi:uncharacterized protein (TIGR02145 family)
MGGICQANAEWTVLTTFVGTGPGTKLKAASGWNSGNSTDDFGFSALPGGYSLSSGSFDPAGYYGGWWSASEVNSNYAYRRGMDYNSESVGSYNISKTGLYSVRCLQD